MIAMQVGKHLADGVAQRRRQRLAGRLHHGDIDVALPSAGGHLQTDPARAHDR
ncbi:hypothetical protein NIIDMKKI_34260 [Mycobacterium kansasii]|uniref:Uncharacterized protein n=1 Tax=Mycobacterium kansasii TaxID=1768 RepID=A0A7G1IBK0_MYCKA|nr:hypothetical protein NIIDMKKI_34260 [Mycobacterium kansasii]